MTADDRANAMTGGEDWIKEVHAMRGGSCLDPQPTAPNGLWENVRFCLNGFMNRIARFASNTDHPVGVIRDPVEVESATFWLRVGPWQLTAWTWKVSLDRVDLPA